MPERGEIGGPPRQRRFTESKPFELVSDFTPAGDQPQAIDAIVRELEAGAHEQVLLGVTGSGKTFTIANTILRTQRPTLVIAHNKTLATQLFLELRELFPENAVGYFVSYYDYYQPEAYIPSSDTYIEKDSIKNDRIDKLRHGTTRDLLTRRDVIIVASVSCIYGLGSPEAYMSMMVELERGQTITRDEILRRLAVTQYTRNDYDLRRGTFRTRGDVIDVVPAHEEARAIRIEMFGDEVEVIREIDPLTGEDHGEIERVEIYPKSHYVTPEELLERALGTIEAELDERLDDLRTKHLLVEAQRLEQRTTYDLELLREVGACNGIENYSRHLTGREPGQPPPTLMDYLHEDTLLIIDESHQTLPQIGAMYKGDRSRKETLVEFGFRLPSALDNRPLRAQEFEEYAYQRIYVSATPGPVELERCGGRIAEQVVRPTGLTDPPVEIRPTKDQVHDLATEVRARADSGERTLVTTLTKRMAEDLTEYYLDEGIRAKYLHADIDTMERADIIKALRQGEFDCLVGINLLREGLDLPEVSLIGILDADKEGFLRSATSLIQTFGRAARNVNGRVIMYADSETRSMKIAISETDRRRKIQEEYNVEHGITPTTISKKIGASLAAITDADYLDLDELVEDADENERGEKRLTPEDIRKRIKEVRAEMLETAKRLEFEKAAELRDELQRLERLEMAL